MNKCYEKCTCRTEDLITLCICLTRRTKNDELADEVKFLQATGAGGAGGARHAGGAAGLDGLETIPPSVKERLLRLEHENKKLRAATGTAQNADLLQTMIDDLKERETQLQVRLMAMKSAFRPIKTCKLFFIRRY